MPTARLPDLCRDLGGMLFFTARDHTGVLQFIVSEDFPEAAEAAAKLRVEVTRRSLVERIPGRQARAP